MNSVAYSLIRLWTRIGARRRMQFFALLLIMILASFAEVVSIGSVLPFLGILIDPENVFQHPFLRPIISFMGITDQAQLLLPVTILFCCAAIFAGAARILLLWSQTKLSHAIGADLSFDIYRRTLYQSYAVHVSRNSSSVIAAISTKANSVVQEIILPILVIISSTVMMLTIVVALLVIEPIVASVAIFGFTIIYGLVVIATKNKLSENGKKISQKQNEIMQVLQEGLGGIRDVLIDGTQELYCRIYRRADLPLRKARATNQIIGNSPRYVIEAMGMVLIALLAYSMIHGQDGVVGAIPVLGMLVLGAQRLLPALQQSYHNWTYLRGGNAILVDALDLLDQPIVDEHSLSHVTPVPFNENIRMENLCFEFQEGVSVIKNVNLTIPKGAKVGLIGSTGSGKSTLTDLIMALLIPSKGALYVDNQTITPQNSRGWQSHISHVPQSIFLSDSTVSENIAFGVSTNDIDENRVRHVAKLAQLDKTIESWDLKYSTIVGERGVRLSGGQRQRIGIARALYKRSSVLIFDEATSALDNNTEQSVMESLDGLGNDLTVVIVAHRLSTLKNCSLIIELEQGQVRRTGSYLEIIEGC
jgi:ATP-binding cassette subfamily B protein